MLYLKTPLYENQSIYKKKTRIKNNNDKNNEYLFMHIMNLIPFYKDEHFFLKADLVHTKTYNPMKSFIHKQAYYQNY